MLFKPDQLLRVEIGGRDYLVRVKAIAKGGLKVSPPLKNGDWIRMKIGEEIKLSLLNDKAIYLFKGKVLDLNYRDEEPSILVSFPQDLVKKLVTRSGFRLQEKIEVRCFLSKGEIIRTSKDISNRGVLLLGFQGGEIMERERFKLEILLPGEEPIPALGQVKRLIDQGDGSISAAIEFLIISQKDRERLTHNLFELDRLQRKAKSCRKL